MKRAVVFSVLVWTVFAEASFSTCIRRVLYNSFRTAYVENEHPETVLLSDEEFVSTFLREHIRLRFSTWGPISSLTEPSFTSLKTRFDGNWLLLDRRNPCRIQGQIICIAPPLGGHLLPAPLELQEGELLGQSAFIARRGQDYDARLDANGFPARPVALIDWKAHDHSLPGHWVIRVTPVTVDGRYGKPYVKNGKL